VLDFETLTIVQAAVAICAFGLVFMGTYRTTRAPFAGWWSAALAASGLSTIVSALLESSLPLASAALGNAIAVVGAFFTLMAARSLRQKTSRWWAPVVIGAAVIVGTVAEHPTGAAWPGGAVLLVGMWFFVGLAAAELWSLSGQRKSRLNGRRNDGEMAAAIVAMAIASTATSAFYGMRVVVFATVGPTSWFYETWAGPSMTTFVMTLVLLVVTYSVTTMSHDRLARQWKFRAMNDDLTALFTRTEFRERARAALKNVSPGASPAVIVADLDHFKTINDRFGHAAGDKALVAFADAVRHVLGEDDIAARFGGEEFVFLIADAGRERVTEVTHAIDTAFAAAGPDRHAWPTVSYGAALGDSSATIDELVERADKAMYQAKAAGRARVVVFEALPQ